jgi:hypothetical protein
MLTTLQITFRWDEISLVLQEKYPPLPIEFKFYLTIIDFEKPFAYSLPTFSTLATPF